MRIGSFVVAAALLCGSASGVPALGQKSAANSNIKVCETPACKHLAQFLLKQINASADPCTDFYQHACGGFVAAHPLPDFDAMQKAEAELNDPPIGSDSRRWFIAQEIIKNATRDGFEAIDNNDPTIPNALKYAKRYYESCLAWDKASETNQNEVLQYIKDFAIWPFLNPDDWLEDDISFVDVVARLFGSLGVSSVVTLEIAKDKFDTSKNSLYLKPPTFDLGGDINCFNASSEMNQLGICGDFVASYRRLIVRAFKTLAINAGIVIKGGTAGLRNIAQEIVDFEGDLVLHTTPEPLSFLLPGFPDTGSESLEEIKSKYHPLSLKEMNTIYNSTKLWQKFFRTAFRNETEGLSWIKDKKSKVIVTQIDYFKFLAEKYVTTPKHVIANYLLWKLVAKLGYAIGEDYSNLYASDQNGKDRKTIVKRDLPPGRIGKTSKDCFDEVEQHFQDAVTRVYIDRRFKKPKFDATNKMAQEIVGAAKEIFDENKWLSEKAKPRFQDKLKNLVLNVGYPEWVHNASELDRRYGKWKEIVSNTSYFANTIRFLKWNYKKLFVPVDRNDFADDYPTSTGNAHYDPEVNALTIPAGTFEYPYFDEEYPEAFNFGLTGVIAGHEIFHGFDNQGVLYDAFGNNSQSVELGGSWLLEGSNETFNNLIRCLSNEFDNYCYDIPSYQPTFNWGAISFDSILNTEAGNISVDITTTTTEATTTTAPPPTHKCIDGNFTLGENLADFNGVRAAFRAYKNSQKKSKNPEVDLRLPGLEHYTMDQLFFIGFSVFWCQPYSPLALDSQLTYGSLFFSDPHSPGEARVNEVAKQFPTFAETFNCPAGAKLKPESVCTVY